MKVLVPLCALILGFGLVALVGWGAVVWGFEPLITGLIGMFNASIEVTTGAVLGLLGRLVVCAVGMLACWIFFLFSIAGSAVTLLEVLK